MTLHPLSQIANVIKRRDTPKSLTQQGKFKTYPVAMSGVLDSAVLPIARDIPGQSRLLDPSGS
jgi:hypothetical protein